MATSIHFPSHTQLQQLRAFFAMPPHVCFWAHVSTLNVRVWLRADSHNSFFFFFLEWTFSQIFSSGLKIAFCGVDTKRYHGNLRIRLPTIVQLKSENKLSYILKSIFEMVKRPLSFTYTVIVMLMSHFLIPATGKKRMWPGWSFIGTNTTSSDLIWGGGFGGANSPTPLR